MRRKGGKRESGGIAKKKKDTRFSPNLYDATKSGEERNLRGEGSNRTRYTMTPPV